MNSFQKILTAAALLAAMSPAAHALDLFTPPTQRTNGVIYCRILNVGTKPIEVSSTVKDPTNTQLNDLTFWTNCPVSPSTLPPGLECLSLSEIGGSDAYCHFTTTSSKVRAVLRAETIQGVVTSELPATK